MRKSSGKSARKGGTKSKKRAKSNGKADTFKTFIPASGPFLPNPKLQAMLPKPEEPRSRKWRKGPPKPPMLYKIDEMVSIPHKYFQYTNGRIVGYEWGGDHRDIRRDVWCYWVRPDYASGSARLIPENELGKIS